MNFKPLVSVIIPTFNRKILVQEAIDSALSQTYPLVEVIVIDDGSNDGTGDALTTKYGGKIRYEWQENKGLSMARNRGIEISQGKLIALLDSDDLWATDKLTKQVPVLNSDSRIGMVYSQAYLIDANGNRINSHLLGYNHKQADHLLENLCIENNVTAGGSTALIRRSAIEDVGYFDPQMHFFEDWDLWLRMRNRWIITLVTEPLAFIRLHSRSQHYFPNEQLAKSELSDRLRMLKKVFATSPNRFPPNLRRSIVAHHYGVAAFTNYAVGQGEIACQDLTHAARLDPKTWKDKDRLGEELVSIALKSIVAEGLVTARSGIRCVEEAFAHWPTNIPLEGNWKRNVLSRLYAGTGFKGFKNGNMQLARRSLIRALYLDPKLLRNVGVFSIIGETIFGARLMGVLRRLARFVKQPTIEAA